MKQPQADLLAPVEQKSKPAQSKAKPAKPAPKPAAVPAKKQEVATVQRLAPAKAEPAQPQNMLAVIAAAAADPRVDVEKMRALLTMQQEVTSEERRIAFTEAFVSMQAHLPSISRDGKIVIEKNGKIMQTTKYASFENIYNTVRPVLEKHGFAYWSEPDLGNESVPIIMRGHLDHIAGHGKTCAIPLPFETSGSKNNVQGVGSSLSYGRRYCLINLLSIVSHAEEDRDRDGASPVPLISGKQGAELTKLIESSGLSIDKFCVKYGIDSVAELPAHQHDEAVGAVRAFAKKAAAEKVKAAEADAK